MTIVIIVDALYTNLDGACLTKVLNHLVWMLRTWYAFEVTKQQWHSLLRINKVDDLLILSALIYRSLHNWLVVIWALCQSFALEHLFYTRSTECATALM